MQHLNPLSSVRSLSVLWLAFALAVAFLPGGAAQAAPLTEDRIRSFIDSMEEAEKLGEEYPALEQARTEKPGDMSRPMSSSIKVLDDHPEAREKLKAIVENHGFDSVPDWAEVGDRIFVSMMAINFQDLPEDQRTMMESMTAPDAGSNISEARKIQMQQMADYMRGAMEAADSASPEDIEAVRPFVDELQAMSGE